MPQHCCRCCGCWLKETAFFEKATHEKESLAVEQKWNGSWEAGLQVVVATTRGHWQGQEGAQRDGRQRAQRIDSSSLHSSCSKSDKEKGFPTGPSSFVNSGPVFTAISVPCLIFTVEQKRKERKKKSNFTVVGRIGVNWPSLERWRPLSDSHWKRQPLGSLFSHLAWFWDFPFNDL